MSSSIGDYDNVEVAQEAITLQTEYTDPILKEWKEGLFDLIKDIKDPEKPNTLEELKVVREELVEVSYQDVLSKSDKKLQAKIGFVPTVPHCTLATLIGLCLRSKLQLPQKIKVDLYIVPGSHESWKEISKQINDKERVSAALENPNLKQLVQACIEDN